MLRLIWQAGDKEQEPGFRPENTGQLFEASSRLRTLENDGDGVRQQVIEVFTRLDETVYRLGPNRSGYRGTSYRLLSRVLGVYLMGVKREPTTRRNTYCCVNVGSAMIDLKTAKGRTLSQAGLAAIEVIIAWRSGRSSRSRKTVRHRAKGHSHCKRKRHGYERTNMYVRYHQNPTQPCPKSNAQPTTQI